MDEHTDNKISMAEAMELLTIGETFAIEKHFGKTLDGGQISAMELAAGVIYAFERRRDPNFRWFDIESWPLKQVNTYFRPEEPEVDENYPETTEGKDDSLAA